MEDTSDARRKRCLELAEEGFVCLKKRCYKEALVIASELEEFRYSAAFDIAAQAQAGMGDLDAAMRTLERGVSKAPDCWLNWQLLGNYRSDAGNYQEAEAAYERALACPNVWEDSVRLNQAVLASRRGDHAAALSQLEVIEDPELHMQVILLRINALRREGRLNEAALLAEKCLQEEPYTKSTQENLGNVVAALARVQLDRGDGPEKVRKFVFDSLNKHYRTSLALFALIREWDNRFSLKAQYYRLMVHVRLSEDDLLDNDARGYYVTYDVVAETVEDGLKLVAQFEERPMDMLEIKTSEAMEPRPEDCMGVYWRTVRVYYRDEEK